MTVRQAIGGVGWYLRAVSGESDYDRYVAHREKDHPGDPVMSRAEFWRWRMDDRDKNPRARCC